MDFKSIINIWWTAMTKDLFNISGKMTRKEYVIFYLVSLAVLIFTWWLIFPAFWIGVANLTAAIRRYHDINKPGWMVIINYIFLIQLYGLYLNFFVKSEQE